MNEVAQTIAEQIGRKALYLLGAKSLVGSEDSLTFKIGRNSKGVTHVIVRLDPCDTYTVSFLKQKRAPAYGLVTLEEVDDIYCDQLQDVIATHTGFYTEL